MQRPPPSAGACTNRPDLYCGTYWGNGRFDGETVTAAIIENRNRFAADNRLARRVSVHCTNRHWPQAEIDHLEAYATTDGRVLVLCSNYNYRPPAHLGMVEIPPLYLTSATTYCRTFETATEARRALRDPEERR